MTDLELAKRCLAGDRNAQEMLWKTYSGKMYAVCRRYFDRDEEAKDALQESFIKVYGHLDQWGGHGPLGAWIRRVVINTSLNLLKTGAKLKLNVALDKAQDLCRDDADALSRLGEEELIRMIQIMPPGYRTVFNLFAIEGFAHKEIGEMMGITENTSKTQFLKAKNWLKQKLQHNTTDTFGA